MPPWENNVRFIYATVFYVCIILVICLLLSTFFSDTSIERFAQEGRTRKRNTFGPQRIMRIRKGQDKKIPACENACKSHQAQTESVIMFNPIAPVRPATDALLLCGKKNFNADVWAMTQMRKSVLEKTMEVLHNQTDFIIFFTKANFEGRMFFFSAHQNIKWSASEPDKDPDDMTYDNIKKEYDKDEEQERNPKPTYIEKLSGKDDGETHINMDEFMEEFPFDVGSKFSCIVPGNVEYIQIIPFDATDKPSEGWTGLKIQSGKHSNISYNKSPPAEFNIKVNKTEQGWVMTRLAMNSEGKWVSGSAQ